MRILQVVPTLSAGGAEGFVTNLACELSLRKHDVIVFLLAGVRGERGQVLLGRLARAGVSVRGAADRKPASARNLLELTALIRSFRPDIVQANLYSSEVACIFARLLSFDLHGRYVRRLASTALYRNRVGAISHWVRDQLFHRTIACSHAVESVHLKLVGRSGAGRSTTIINGGLLYSETTKCPKSEAARSVLGVGEGVFLVAHIGSMHRPRGGTLATAQKAHDTLLKAFAKAFGHSNDTLLALSGDGELRKEVELLSEELGIRQKVFFLGGLPEPWPLLVAADVFFFPSRYEGMPNVLPEAASCGLPVVASDIPEIRSIHSDDPWILCPVDDVNAFADALYKMYGDIERYSREANELLPHIRERYSMEGCASGYEGCYLELVLPPVSDVE